MKRKIIFSLTILLMFACLLTSQTNFHIASASTLAQNLTITGNSTIYATPDRAEISARIETLDMDNVKSKNENFEIFDKVVKALIDAGISKENITLDYYSSYPNYDYNNGKTLLGYHTSTTFSVYVDNLDIKSYVDIWTENGATSINSVTYSLSNLDSVYNDAIKKAILNAEEKAKFLGYENLTAIGLKEETVYSSGSLYRSYSENSTGSELIGKISVNAKVTVNFSNNTEQESSVIN